ncbi:MAG: hypothetical protein QXS24_06165 [Desulfurococcaceae archaeon]
MAQIIEFDKVKNLDRFIEKLSDSGYLIEQGPHVVLEDHSELATLKVYKGNKLIAYIVAHYITQYYRAVISESYSNDQSFLDKLFEIKYSGEKWSIPVNPLYIIVFEEEILNAIRDYEDAFPIEDGENMVREYVSRNPQYRSIPRIVIARIIE